MKECFIVVHKNHSEGMCAYAFYKEADARKSVEEDVKDIEKGLIEQGYSPKTLKNGLGDNVVVCVSDSDISYEWNIVISDIQ